MPKGKFIVQVAVISLAATMALEAWRKKQGR